MAVRDRYGTLFLSKPLYQRYCHFPCAAVKCLSCRAGLAYCRHLSTVRTHLSALVNHAIVAPDAPNDAHKGLNADVWQTFLQDCSVSSAGAIHIHPLIVMRLTPFMWIHAQRPRLRYIWRSLFSSVNKRMR